MPPPQHPATEKCLSSRAGIMRCVPTHGTTAMTQTFNVGAQSRLVNATAWLVMLLAVLAVAALVHRAAAAALPAAGWLLVGAATLLATTAVLGVAVGLLLRLEWARRSAVALLALAALANLTGLWLQHDLLLSLLLLAGCALLGWTAWRLTLPMVRQEFA